MTLKGISLFQQKTTFVKDKHHKQWEADLETTYPDDQWIRAHRLTYKVICCFTLWELSHKINLWWYLTQDKLSHFQDQRSKLYWRQWGKKGDLLHTLWGCKKLPAYWSSIFALIFTNAQTSISPSPDLALLNLGMESLPLYLRHTTTHILLAARLCITRIWKSCTPPSLSNTEDLIQLYCTYEHFMASIMGK